MAAVTVRTENVLGTPISGANVSVFDTSQVLQDSGLTDVDGVFATTLTDSVGGITYLVVATKDGVAFGNSTPIKVVTP